MIDPEKVETVEAFLALSMLLEFESADRLRELSATMREHHAEELAQLLDKLAGYSDMHGSEIQDLAAGHVLPDLATMGVSWEGLEGPETTMYESINPDMLPYDVLQVALRNEIKGQDFYTNISLHSPNEDVRKLAAEFANEENEHVALMQQWMDNYSQSKADS
jgi:hypothetical protein